MIQLSEAVRHDRLNAVRDAMDAETSPAILRIYSGARPSAGAAPAGDLLVEMDFAQPSAADAASGQLTFNGLSQGTAVETGTAAWARIVDGADAFVADMDVSENGGGGDVQLNTTAIVSGAPVDVLSASFSEA